MPCKYNMTNASNMPRKPHKQLALHNSIMAETTNVLYMQDRNSVVQKYIYLTLKGIFNIYKHKYVQKVQKCQE